MISSDLLDIAAQEGVNKALEYVVKQIDEKTPEDTRELVSNNKITKATTNSGIVKGEISNKTPYAIFVEYGASKEGGVPTTGKKYKYHKPSSTVFYKGVGARMYARTKFDEKVKNTVGIIIKGSVDKFIKKVNQNYGK